MLLSDAEAILRERTGLVFSQPRRAALLAALESSLRCSGLADAAEYLERVREEAQLPHDLVDDITVGETYFFRDERQFSEIRDRILPELSASSGGRRLRLWSAGCATGEEAYSLAILMRQRGEAAYVIGTDISRGALERARMAIYRAWSLRGVPETVVSQYFRRTHGRFALDAELRDAVEFRHLNLANAGYPSRGSGLAEVDLILCRNVLIYFDPPTVAQVAGRLIESLHPDGWLLVGASDPPLQELVACDMVLTPAGRAYRKPARGVIGGRARVHQEARGGACGGSTDHPSPRSALRPIGSRVRDQVMPGCTPVRRSQPRPARRDSATVGRLHKAAGVEGVTPDVGARERIASLYRARNYEEAAGLAAKLIAEVDADAALWIILVRAQANRGKLRLADAACLAAIELHPLNAELTYLHGVLMIEAGLLLEAMQAFRRAIYLDRSLTVAHMALGQVLGRTGNADAARRAFRNAEQLLAGMDPDEAVAGADGETAARLLSMARTQSAMVDVGGS